MIPGVTYHKRVAWEDPNLRVFDPPRYTPPLISLSLIDTVVLHYTAADNLIDGDPGEHASDLPGYLRAIQRDYRLSRDPKTGALIRGYSIGYSFAVDWLGGVWELRGFDYRAAATGGKKVGGNVNPRSIAILCLVDGQDPLTAEALASVNAIIAEAERRTNRKLHIGPHSEFDWTGCCGDGIRGQLASGLIRAQEIPVGTDPDIIDNHEVRAPLFQVLVHAAQHPGGGVQGALWDTVLPHVLKVHFPVGHPLRTEFEQAARAADGPRTLAAWGKILAAAP